MKNILEFHAIEKSFFGVKVLKGISFALSEGGALGLVGENGAGKSTLMNLLGGNLRPDSGRMLLKEEDYRPRSPREAERAGVAFIHQELNLFPNLSIAENIFLTRFPRRGLMIDRAAIRNRADALLKEVGLALPSDTLVERLSAGERQLVEIAKALSYEPRIVILDEPTTSLTSVETERLFALLARLRAQGISMIYISHALEDVLRLCDDIVILRDGEVAGTGACAEFNSAKLISLMVGRSIEQLFPSRQGASATEAILEVRQVSEPNIVRRISFSLRAGEVLGISGLMGSGRTELARILFGLDRMSEGEILLNCQPIHRLPPRERMRRGLAFLTESRREDGLFMEASIADNLTIVSAPRLDAGSLGWLRRGQLGERVQTIREAVKLTRGASDLQAVKTLSGGNQQKVALGKWLLNEPRVFILDEPTRGIDIGAKQEIYSLINKLAAAGSGVLMISSEIEELIGMCDRLLVMAQGEIRDEVARPEFDRERILRASLHGRPTEAAP